MDEQRISPPDSNLSASRILSAIWRRAPIVIGCLVITVGVAAAYSLYAKKKYTATASLVFNNAPLSQQIAGLQPVNNYSPQSLQDTNVQLLKLGDLAQKTAERVGNGLTPSAVANSVSITPSGDTTVVNVSSTLRSPQLAAKVANVYANTFVTEQSSGNRAYYEAALATVQRQIDKLSTRQERGAQGLVLQERAQSLATLAQIKNDALSVAQSATVPSSASSPKPAKAITLALLAGLLLGVLLAFAAERLDQHIRDLDELERIYRLPLLGAVPQTSSLGRGVRSGSGALSPEIADTFQFVRARLRYFNIDSDLRVLAVVSSQPGDGKTTIAHWLSYAAASVGSRVLLIEADLRRPTMADELGLSRGPGLADVLIGSSELRAVIQPAPVEVDQNATGSARAIDAIVAGALPPNPAEMLESQAMQDLLLRVQSEYDLVILDTPPLGVVSDALSLMACVDGAVVVVGMKQSRRDAARNLRDTLNAVEAPLLGIIANKSKPRDGSNYGYGYQYSPAATKPKDAGGQHGDSSAVLTS